MIRILAGAVVLAVAYRVRGGGFVDLESTTLYRLIWALSFAAVVGGYAVSRGVNWRIVPLLALASFAMMLNGHAAHMDMGWSRNGFEEITFWLWDDGFWADFVGMTVVGAVRGLVLALPFLYLYPRAFMILPLGGLISATGYTIGWGFPWIEETTGLWPSHVGEFVTGFGYGLLALLVVSRTGETGIASPPAISGDAQPRGNQ